MVLDKGKLVQSGHHKTLILERGIYQHLWNKQFPVNFKDNPSS